MSMVHPVLLVVGALSLVAGVAGVAFDLAMKSPTPRPTLGNRGLKRAHALSRPVFAFIEPATRYLAARLSELWPQAARSRLLDVLTRSGDYLGLSEDELAAMSVLSAAGVGGLALLLGALVDLPWALPGAATLLGGLAPWLRVRAVASGRAKRVTRSLPGVIELVAMCMGAGLD